MEGAMASPTEPPSYPRLEPILDAVASWVSRYRYAVGLRKELQQCGADEVARTARDLGISPRELVRLANRGPAAADLLPKLLRALGVDPATLARQDPLAMRDLQRLCITCGEKRRCEHELAAGTAARHYRSFCPNAFTLDALFKAKGEQAGAEPAEPRKWPTQTVQER
jgi:hypothetical protein